MPNVKIFVDDSLYPALRAPVMATLEPLRDLLCTRFDVDVPACQFAVVPVGAMPDLPRVNVEMAILPRPDRTRMKVTAVSEEVRSILKAATGVHVAVRVVHLDPATYVALK